MDRLTIRVVDADTARPAYRLLMDFQTGLRAQQAGLESLAVQQWPSKSEAVAAADRLGRLILRYEEGAEQ